MLKRAVILLALLMCSAVGAIKAQVRECIIDERFSSNVLGWPEDNNQNFSASVCEGIYTIKHKKTSGSQTFDIPSTLYPGRNFFIETEGRFKSGDKANGFGLVWGKGHNGFFSFVITQNGSYYVREAKAGGKGEYLINPTSSKFIKTGGAVNKLRVQCQKGVYSFFINQNYVSRLPFEPFYGDNLGLVLYGQQEVEITCFGVYGTKKTVTVNSQKPQINILGYAINDGVDDDGAKLGNGNSRINSGEIVKMAVTLKNFGQSSARDMSAMISSDNQRVRMLDANKRIPIATTNPNETAKVLFKFFVADDFTGNDISLKVDILDLSGKIVETLPFKVPLNTGLPNFEHHDNNSLSISFKDTPTDVNTSLPVTKHNADNTVVVIVGIENYQYLPKATYADNDARIFFNYMAKVLNVPRQNIIIITDNNATYANINNIFKTSGRIQHLNLNRIDNVIFYFSGLGAVDSQSSAPYIMAYDSRPNTAAETGYPVADIFKQLQGVNPKSIVCLFETSFAGVDRSGNAFEENGGTFWSLPSLPVLTHNNIAAMYASAGEQAAPVIGQSQHGLFTHWLLLTINNAALHHTPLSMKTLFSNVSREMMRECTKRGITVVPKLDCINKDIITILK